MFNKFAKRTGVYHIRDNIEQLNLQIHFRHIDSLLLPTENLDNGEDLQTRKSLKCIEIRWQEKILSPSELERFKEAYNCVTETQKRYNQWILEVGAIARVGQYNAVAENSSKKKIKQLKKRMKKGEQKTAEKNEHENTPEIFTYVHEDHHMPSGGANLTNHQTREDKTDHVVMYIYASLQPEIQLVALCWNPKHRMLRIYPDFNDIQENPYYAEVGDDYRHLYAYSVENISPIRTTVDPFISGITLPFQWDIDDKLSSQFDMVSKYKRRVVLLLELNAAYNFLCSGALHIRYHIQLPDNTTLEEGDLEASTHSSTSSSSHIRSHRFGYTWEIVLLCDEDYQVGEQLHVYFQAISIDGWERERIEGYAHYTCYLNAGQEFVSLQCLRPVETLWEAVASYFVGGRRQHDFAKFYNSGSPQILHNRLQYRMQSAGNLHFTCQRFTQCYPELLHPTCGVSKNNMTLDDIMLAYQISRKRLEELLH